MTPFASVVEQVEAHGLTLVRAHPRRDRLHLDLEDGDAGRVVGQWISDPEQATRVASATDAVAPGLVELRGSRLVLQRGGADRRLPSLAPLVAAGADLVAHRPERRAVVRTGHPDPVWTKVVRPRRTADIVARVRAAAAVPGLIAPDVQSCDERAGTITLTTLPGATLHDLLTSGVDPSATVQVGRAVRTLHDAADLAPAGTLRHDLMAEVRAAQDLLELARAHRALDAPEADRCARDLVAAAAAVDAVGPPAAPALLHRDLHDKQLLVDGRTVGMLDVDTLALGDPALDLGNLLAHLDLRVRQGWATPEVAHAVEQGVLEGYAPDDRTLAGTRAHRALTSARLRVLYAFRPGDLLPSSPSSGEQ